MLVVRYLVALAIVLTLFNTLSLVSLHYVWQSLDGRQREASYIEQLLMISSFPLQKRQDEEPQQTGDVVMQRAKKWEQRTEEQWREEFWREGTIGPFHLLSEPEIHLIKQEFDSLYGRRSLELWEKSRWLQSTMLVSLGLHPQLLGQVEALLGGNVLLYGLSRVETQQGQVHRWHIDVENRECERSATVWMGLVNIAPENALLVISRTQSKGLIPQEFEPTKLVLEDTGEDMHKAFLKKARSLDEGAVIYMYEAFNGDYLIFHGQVWHASVNPTSHPRQGVILQYVGAECVIRQPMSFNPPYPVLPNLPPVLLVPSTSGEERGRKENSKPAKTSMHLNHILQPDPDTMALLKPSSSSSLPSFYRPHLRIEHRYRYVEPSSPILHHQLSSREQLEEERPLIDGATFFAGSTLNQRKPSLEGNSFLFHRTPLLDFLKVHLSMRRPSSLNGEDGEWLPYPRSLPQNDQIIIVTGGELLLTLVPERKAERQSRNNHDSGQSPLPADLPEETILQEGDVAFIPAGIPHAISCLSQPFTVFIHVTFGNEGAAANEEDEDQKVPRGYVPVVVRRVNANKFTRIEALKGQNQTLTENEGNVFFNETSTATGSRVVGRTAILAGGAAAETHQAPQEALVVVEKGSVAHSSRQGRRLTVGDMVYLPRGATRGFQNTGKRAAHLIVFEFHPNHYV
ncbi:hypothetical protein QOT17_001639 [Balamuthia mandrillaris]